jgi:hypothetical protein
LVAVPVLRTVTVVLPAFSATVASCTAKLGWLGQGAFLRTCLPPGQNLYAAASEPHYGSKRWGNMERAQRVDSAIEIMGKAEPTSERSNRRTELEHKAVKAAQSAWSHLKGEAGLKPQTASKTNRKGASKRRAAGDEVAVRAARLTAPHFVAPIDAVKFYENLAADLLKAVNSNAMATPIALKSAVQDFRAAVRKAATELKAGAKRTAAAKATRGTVSAATIAARTQNPRPTATVN